jgi:hypothetical protein
MTTITDTLQTTQNAVSPLLHTISDTVANATGFELVSNDKPKDELIGFTLEGYIS